MTPLLRSAAVLVLAVMPALAQSTPAPSAAPPAPVRRGPGRLARVLGLTEAQTASLRTLRDKHRPELVARREGLRQAQVAFRAALADPATPEAQLRTLHEKAAAARFDLLMAGRALRLEVQAVLTPEQRAKAAELRTFARARHRQRMHRFGLGLG